MHRHRVSVTVLAAALSSCVVEPELLNSERIQSEFGSFGIEIIAYVGGIRRANLYSVQNDVRTCRTYAVVRFDNVPADVIGAEHAQIIAGESIGATFKESGWRIYKETRHIGELQSARDEHSIRSMMHVDREQKLAMHVYRLLLRKDEQMIEYATIVEVHHPEYMTEQRLYDLFAVDTIAESTSSERQAWTKLVVGEG